MAVDSQNRSGWGERLRFVVQDVLKVASREWKPRFDRFPNAMYAYFSEKTPPDLALLLQVSGEANVSLDWLVSGIGPMSGGLDRSKLQTAVTAAMKIVESARQNGRGYNPEEISAFIVDIYESMIKEAVDGNHSHANVEAVSRTEAPHGRNRKESA